VRIQKSTPSYPTQSSGRQGSCPEDTAWVRSPLQGSLHWGNTQLHMTLQMGQPAITIIHKGSGLNRTADLPRGYMWTCGLLSTGKGRCSFVPLERTLEK
jgi:hypothetical protein